MTHDPEAATGAPALAVHLAGLVVQAIQELPQRLHPGWLETIGLDAALRETVDDGLLRQILEDRFDLCWPDLSAAHEPLELTWLLPLADWRRLCAARVVYACRDSLGRSIAAATRRAARAAVGPETFERLLELPDRRRTSLVVPAWDAPSLARAGWRLLEQQLGWGDPRSHRMALLCWPPEPAAAPAFAARPADEHAGFVHALSHLFPEHPWLSGSRLADLKSA